MKKILFWLVAICLASVCGAAESYMVSMRVGNAKTDSSIAKSGSKGGRIGHGSSSQTKTTTSSMEWPVTVSCQSKGSLPKLKLHVYYFSAANGKTSLLQEKEVAVDFDEKGVFKTDLESPTVKLVKQTTRTNSNSGRGGHGRHRGGGSSSTKTKTTGDRIAGCIIQLMDGNKVVKSYSSNSTWTIQAKKFPLPIENITGGHM